MNRKTTWLTNHSSPIILLTGIAIMLVAYYPSLFHAFRADTVSLARQFSLKTGFIDSVVLMYDLPRDLAISGGDYTQFRPICYWLLGTEVWFFRYNFVLWQAVGIVLHGFVVILMYRLLLKISKKEQDVVAAMIAAFFASLLVSAELVIWQGCHSWLLLVIFVLCALYHALVYVEENRSVYRLLLIVAFMLLACFTSEVGMFLVFPVAGYVFIASSKEKRKYAGVLFLPVALYVVISFFDSSKASAQAGSEFADIIQRVWSLGTLYNLALAVTWWLFAGFFPGELSLDLSGRLFEVEPITAVISRFNWTTPPYWLGMVSAIAFVLMILKGFKKGASLRYWIFSGAVFAALAAYVFVLVVVRLNVRGVESLNYGLYYSYLFWVLFLVWIYTVVDTDTIVNIRLGRYLSFTLATGLICWNMFLLFNLNSTMIASFADNKKVVAMVSDFVELHKSEADFSFYMPLDYRGNYAMPYVKTKNPWTCSFVESLFPKYFNGINPKYIFRQSDD